MGFEGNFIPLPAGFGLPFPPAFRAEPPFICRTSGPTIGRVVRTGEARVRIRSGRFVRIGRFGRNSLTRPFNPRFFSTQDFDLPQFEGLSAVRRSKFRSMDQRTVLENRCVFLPLSSWEVVRPNGAVRNVVNSRDMRNCVSFLSTGTATQIRVIFMWDSAADLDLSVTEPGSGFEVAFSSPESPNGGFLFEDAAMGDCAMNGGMRQAVEMIEYSGLATPPSGTYTVNLSQFGPCPGMSANYQVTVMIGDDTVIDESGAVGPGTTGTFETLTFTFP